jgi:hypothetical protein
LCPTGDPTAQESELDGIESAVWEHGGAALRILEQLCLETSPRDDARVCEAVRQLLHLRDQLIVAGRAGARCSDDLGRTNAILSSVFGLEFPISDAQRLRIREARDGINDMLRLLRGGDDPCV